MIPSSAKALISANNTPSLSLNTSLLPLPLAVSAARWTDDPEVGM